MWQHCWMIPPISANRCVLGPLVRSNIYYDYSLVYDPSIISWYHLSSARQGRSSRKWPRVHHVNLRLFNPSLIPPLVSTTRIIQQEMAIDTAFPSINSETLSGIASCQCDRDDSAGKCHGCGFFIYDFSILEWYRLFLAWPGYLGQQEMAIWVRPV